MLHARDRTRLKNGVVPWRRVPELSRALLIEQALRTTAWHAKGGGKQKNSGKQQEPSWEERAYEHKDKTLIWQSIFRMLIGVNSA